MPSPAFSGGSDGGESGAEAVRDFLCGGVGEGGGAVGEAETEAVLDGGEGKDQWDQGAGGGDAEVVEDLGKVGIGGVGLGGVGPGLGHVDVGDTGDEWDGLVEKLGL